jgi:hypothetical protein
MGPRQVAAELHRRLPKSGMIRIAAKTIPPAKSQVFGIWGSFISNGSDVRVPPMSTCTADGGTIVPVWPTVWDRGIVGPRAGFGLAAVFGLELESFCPGHRETNPIPGL